MGSRRPGDHGAGPVVGGGYVQTQVGVLTAMQSTLDGTLRSNNFPGGAWPKAESKALTSAVETVGGWSY